MLALLETLHKTEGSTSFWSAVPSLLWFSLLLIALLCLSKEIRAILRNLAWRLRIGAPIKLGSIEFGNTYVSRSIDLTKDETTFEHRPDENHERWNQREKYYVPNRNIHLVHRLAPSRYPGMLYDIELYVTPHKGATLAAVGSVEYYFGRHWGNQIFVTRDRARSFSITTSAYGPFMCTAKLVFTDGEPVIVNRYVDFEMGSIGKESSDVEEMKKPF